VPPPLRALVGGWLCWRALRNVLPTPTIVQGFSDHYAIWPMLAVGGGSLMMLSTPYGKRGVFYEEWTSGGGWERYEVPASQCPRIPASFLEEERAALPSWVYRQEYECSFEETEDQVFTTERVERAVTSEVTPLFGSG
jgi:hypothetical protein